MRPDGIYSQSGGALSLTNLGRITSGAGGTATLVLGSGASAGAISGISSEYAGFGAFDVDAGANWTMSGSNTVAQYATISLGASATLTVTGKLTSLGRPTLEGSGTIATSGTGAIEVGTDGTATAGQFVIDSGRTMFTDGAVSLSDVLNRGVVAGLANYGLYLGAGGTVTNFAAGHISGLDDGIAAEGAATMSNQGIITGTSSYGVRLEAGGTVVNSGTIRSDDGDAVQFGAGFANLLVIDPGAVFSGKVDGGNTVGSGAISTLELEAGGGAGTLHGLGSQYVNFGLTTIEAGVSWTLTLPSI